MTSARHAKLSNQAPKDPDEQGMTSGLKEMLYRKKKAEKDAKRQAQLKKEKKQNPEKFKRKMKQAKAEPQQSK